jgi:S1-C subfamily serine protease
MKIKSTYLLIVVMAGISFLMGSLLASRGSSAQDQLPRLVQDQTPRSEDQLPRPGDSMEQQVLSLPPPRSSLGVVGNMAFVVHKVEQGGPAEQLGLQKGDLITEWNGKQIISIKDFLMMQDLEPGQAVEIEFVRPNFTTGKYQTFKGQTQLAPSKFEPGPKQR